MYPHQRERLTEALERAGLAALVATTPENVFYVTGFRSLTTAVFRTASFAVVTPAATALVVPAVDVAPIVMDGVSVDHVQAFGGFVSQYSEAAGERERRIRDICDRRSPSPADAVAAALDALGVGDGRIGLDDGALGHQAWERLVARLGARRVVAGAQAFATARRVKSPYEIECLERALHIVEEGANAVIQMLKPGVTEREALVVFDAEVTRRGAHPQPGSIVTGERTAIAAPLPTERALRRGDLVRVDVSAVYKGYWASLGRTAVMGEPSPRQQAAWDAVAAGLDAALDVVKPGVPAAEVHRAAVDAVRAAGFPDFRRYHVGHAVGLEPYERPKLAGDITTPLELGEVLRVEVPYLEVGWAGVAVRETALVTSTGARTLNRSARGLVVLD
jgi:Xaa-Pro aminopeptidase